MCVLLTRYVDDYRNDKTRWSVSSDKLCQMEIPEITLSLSWRFVGACQCQYFIIQAHSVEMKINSIQ